MPNIGKAPGRGDHISLENSPIYARGIPDIKEDTHGFFFMGYHSHRKEKKKEEEGEYIYIFKKMKICVKK
jgi:hypothetical protein